LKFECAIWWKTKQLHLTDTGVTSKTLEFGEFRKESDLWGISSELAKALLLYTGSLPIGQSLQV
jgi:hypothetical protein